MGPDPNAGAGTGGNDASGTTPTAGGRDADADTLGTLSGTTTTAEAQTTVMGGGGGRPVP